MGQEIVYCHRCQTRLLGSDFERGKAFRINQQATCGDCAKKILDELPQAERDAILNRAKEQEPRKTSTGRIPLHREKSSGDSSHNRIHAITSRATALAPRRKSSALPLVLGIGGVGIVGLIVVVAAMSGSTSDPPPAPRLTQAPPSAGPAPLRPAPATPDPAPPRPLQPRTASAETRLADARRLFAEAKSFADAHPNDFQGQIDRFQKAAFAADGTVLAADASKAVESAKAKLKNFFAKDLAELRTNVLGAAKAGRIAHAAAQIEKARTRYTSADWTAEIHRLKGEVEPHAETRFKSLKKKAAELAGSGDRAGAEAILKRVRTWGFQRLVDDLLAALGENPAPATPEPAPVKPAPKLDYLVYGDGLRSGWRNMSWSSKLNLAADKPVHTGSHAISFTPGMKWAGIRLMTRTPLSTVDYPTLTFAARRADPSVRLTLSFYDENQKLIGKPTGFAKVGGQPPTDRWKTYTVPVALMGAAGRQVGSLIFQSLNPTEKPALFLDDIGFLKTPVADAAPAPAATGYRAEWMNAAALASVRDYDAAIALLSKSKNEEAKQDLEDLRAASELLDEARKAFRAWPAGRNLDALYADATGVAVQVDEPVRESDSERALVRGKAAPVSIPFGEILSGSLAKIALREKSTPTDRENRAAALLSLLEGDVAAAQRYLKELPEKYLAHAQATVQKRISDKKELAARALLYEAGKQYAGYATRGEALKKYAALLKDHVATDVVRRNRRAIETWSKGGREYFFGLADLTGNGAFRLTEHDKEATAWTCAEDVAAPSDRLNTYVELEFSAIPQTEYRAWAYVGGCCAENVAFNLQATGLEGFEPDSGNVTEVDHGVRYLKKTHASHGGGPKRTEKWGWARIRLPKYSSGGPKKVRLLSYHKGFSVAFALVSADRANPPRTSEAQELAKARSLSLSSGEASVLSTGALLWEVWEGINGSDVSNLTDSAKYKRKPDISAPVKSFEAPPRRGNQYGTRIRGYVHPPETGDYTFWIATDDKGELWLSTDGSERNRKKIASVPTAVLNRQWGAHGSQKSEPIRLEKGRRYYIEALQKEGGGDDWLAVGWQLPGGKQERPIPGNRLSPYVVPGSGPVAAQIESPTGGAVIQAGSPVVIEAQVAGAEKGARLEIYQGGRRLGTPRGEPPQYTWRNPDAGTYPISVVVRERGKEAVASTPVVFRVGKESFLFRALNLNGPGLFVDGRSWQGRSSPSTRATGWGLERQDVPLDPPTDSDRATMIRSSISSEKGTKLVLRDVPKGSYRVYLYVWAPESSASFDIALNDEVVASGQRIGPAGAWERLGPWSTEVEGRTITVEARRGLVHFSGVEVWKLGTPPPAPKDPARTDVIGGRGGRPFEDAPDDRPFLIGLRVTRGTFTGQPHAKTVQPIFLKDGGRIKGEVHGDSGRSPLEVVAKEGYAVGAVVGKGNQRINGFKIVFYRINGNVLNPADSYESDWIGGDWGAPEKRLDGNGAPVVGIHGREGGDADCFGLIYLK